MTQQTLKTRLGKRLKTLLSLIPADTTEFWDLCCDHGAVGRAVLETFPSCKVSFNDIHPVIMADLKKSLENYKAQKYKLFTCPAEELILTHSPAPTVLLAGIGSEQCIKILSHLFYQPAGKFAKFIISPATKTHYVRKFLVDHDAYLISEHTVTENKRTYEIITVTLRPEPSATRMVHTEPFLFGNCWQVANSDHINHLYKLNSYYQAQQNNKNTEEIKFISTSYKNLFNKISNHT